METEKYKIEVDTTQALDNVERLNKALRENIELRKEANRLREETVDLHKLYCRLTHQEDELMRLEQRVIKLEIITKKQ